MKCVILQPSYIPWRGYFHQIQKCDLFVFYDDVQYDKRGWRNRNRIKTANGPVWLTIPVHASGAQTHRRLICDITIDRSQPWATRHWQTIQRAYKRMPFFDQYADRLQQFFDDPPELLADFVIPLTVEIAGWLGLADRQFLRSSQLSAQGSKTERLLDILQQVGATHYISGPSAKAYIDEGLFDRAGIGLEYMTYEYPEYPQPYSPFNPQVSVLDLLFAVGPEAPKYIWGMEAILSPDQES